MADGVYAFIGETGTRSPRNEGLNANLGLVVTPAGAVLIDSGATLQGARQIHEAVRRITPQPVKWVSNTGGQDHRWLGNGHFQTPGAELIAHAAGQADMANRGNGHLLAVRTALGPLGTWSLLRQSLHLLFDGVPEGIDLAAVRRLLTGLPGVAEVHDLHVWAMGTSQNALTAHLVLADASVDAGTMLHAAELALQTMGRIGHVTLQLEPPAYARHCAPRGESAC